MSDRCPLVDCDRTFACRPPAPTCPHPFYGRDDATVRIDEARAAFIRARFALTLAVEAACPGPHDLRQHRDGKSPWCSACRRFADGAPLLTQSPDVER